MYIQAWSGIYPRIIQACSGIFKTLYNAGVFETVAYLEP